MFSFYCNLNKYMILSFVNYYSAFRNNKCSLLEFPPSPAIPYQ